MLDCLNIRKLSQSKPQLSLHNHVGSNCSLKTIKIEIMNIEDLMNNPKFKIDIPTFILNLKINNLMNEYRSKAILKRQIHLLELQKGKTGQELENAVEKELEKLNNQFSEWLKQDLIDFVDDSDA